MKILKNKKLRIIPAALIISGLVTYTLNAILNGSAEYPGAIRIMADTMFISGILLFIIRAVWGGLK